MGGPPLEGAWVTRVPAGVTRELQGTPLGGRVRVNGSALFETFAGPQMFSAERDLQRDEDRYEDHPVPGVCFLANDCPPDSEVPGRRFSKGKSNGSQHFHECESAEEDKRPDRKRPAPEPEVSRDPLRRLLDARRNRFDYDSVVAWLMTLPAKRRVQAVLDFSKANQMNNDILAIASHKDMKYSLEDWELWDASCPPGYRAALAAYKPARRMVTRSMHARAL